MKIIFLDIDEVLNSRASVSRNFHSHGKSPICTHNPAKRHIKWLDLILQETNAKIVISSAWRLHCKDTFMWSHLFYACGSKCVPGNIIGVTPDDVSTRHRGTEIAQFLDVDFPRIRNNWQHIERGNWDIESFVILDDGADMEPFMDRLVHVNEGKGLMKKHAEMAIEKLNEYDPIF